jgi:hypothetical protein
MVDTSAMTMGRSGWIFVLQCSLGSLLAYWRRIAFKASWSNSVRSCRQVARRPAYFESRLWRGSMYLYTSRRISAGSIISAGVDNGVIPLSFVLAVFVKAVIVDNAGPDFNKEEPMSLTLHGTDGLRLNVGVRLLTAGRDDVVGCEEEWEEKRGKGFYASAQCGCERVSYTQ